MALGEASRAVQQRIAQVMQHPEKLGESLAIAMRVLHGCLFEHAAREQGEREAVGIVSLRTREQRRLEAHLFLNIVSPIFEAEGIINRDKLRTSLADEDGDVQRRYARGPQAIDRCRAVVEALSTSYEEDLAVFRDYFPQDSKAECDKINERDKIIATEQLQEAKDEYTRADTDLERSGLLPPERDFFDQSSDGRTQSESPQERQDSPIFFRGIGEYDFKTKPELFAHVYQCFTHPHGVPYKIIGELHGLEDYRLIQQMEMAAAASLISPVAREIARREAAEASATGNGPLPPAQDAHSTRAPAVPDAAADPEDEDDDRPSASAYIAQTLARAQASMQAPPLLPSGVTVGPDLLARWDTMQMAAAHGADAEKSDMGDEDLKNSQADDDQSEEQAYVGPAEDAAEARATAENSSDRSPSEASSTGTLRAFNLDAVYDGQEGKLVEVGMPDSPPPANSSIALMRGVPQSAIADPYFQAGALKR
ncbi:hypothetical protein LTR65_008978 [Meristemomyces frigidus]